MGKFADEIAPKFADSTEPVLSDWKEGTIAWYIERRIEESRKLGARPIGSSQFYTMRRLQRSTIGKVMAEKLSQTHLIDYCRARRASKVKPPTINQDLTFLRGTIRDFVELEELPDEALQTFTKAKRRLEKEQLIGKSTPRTRRPTPDELTRLLAHFAKQNLHPRTETDMVLVTEFSYHSARRISETCRLRYGDVDTEKRTCWVYDLKNPK
jgi:integrase